MLRKLLQALAQTLAARLLSALLSFLIFAEVLKALPTGQAAQVLFFSFAFGFVVAGLRSFHLVQAQLLSTHSKSRRLRQLRAAAQAAAGMRWWLLPASAALLLAQAVPAWLALLAAALAWASAADLDLPRAAVGRSPVLPWLTTAGGVLGLSLLWLAPSPGPVLCAAAFLLPWLPVALYRLWVGPRLLRGRRGRSPGAAASPSPSASRAKPAALLVSLYDGAVLNAPFLLSMALLPQAAIDLALGQRLFVASLAAFALVSSWAISGVLDRLARRQGWPVPLVFVLLQCLLGLVIGLAYAGVFAVVSQQVPGPAALGVFAAVLLAYVLHACAIRYGLGAGGPGLARGLLYGALLALFYGFMLLLAARGQVALLPVVAAIVLALAAPPAWAWWRQRAAG